MAFRDVAVIITSSSVSPRIRPSSLRDFSGIIIECSSKSFSIGVLHIASRNPSSATIVSPLFLISSRQPVKIGLFSLTATANPVLLIISFKIFAGILIEYSLSTIGKSGNSSAAMPAISNFAPPLFIRVWLLSFVSMLTLPAASERTIPPSIFAFITISPGCITSASTTASIPISISLPVSLTVPSSSALI